MKKQKSVLPLYFWLEGNSKVGKSCILIRFINNSFWSEFFSPPIGQLAATGDLNGLKINLQIWDAAGRVKHRGLILDGLKIHGVIAAFDLTNAESFSGIINWIYNNEINIKGKKPVILVGNKSDLESERQVSFDKAKSFADRCGISYIEVSALTGKNIQKLFAILACEAIYKFPNIRH